MTDLNRRFVLAERPEQRSVRPEDFRLESVPLPVPGPGEVLVRNLMLSLDPYMRGRMSAAPSYAPPVELGAVMIGETVGEILASDDPALPPGTRVAGFGGWQDYAVLKAATLRPIPEGPLPLGYHLGILGMPGLTAYAALLGIGQPKPGETVLVSAAAGAVGQVVGQIARIKGCRVIGIAGTQEKCDYVAGPLGFDGAILYRGKEAAAIAAEIQALAPGGIDVFFDNVGGTVHDAAMMSIALHARIVICGAISIYDRIGTPDIGIRWMRQILNKRARMEGFLVLDWEHLRADFVRDMTGWLQAGLIGYREDIAEGLEAAPEALIGLLAGRNSGKQLVRIAMPEPR